MKIINAVQFSMAFWGLIILHSSVHSADYPPNEDYGSKGEFLAKRGTEYGRTAILMPVGPLLVNLPEGPGSTDTGLTDGILNRTRDSVWDLSNLRNPTLFRQLGCDRYTEDDPQCFPGQPIHAHATVVRFDGERGPLLVGRNSGDLGYYPEERGNENELIAHEDYWSWGYSPISYLHLTAPYHLRTYWEYGFNSLGQYIIRDTSQHLEPGPLESWTVRGIPELEELFGPSELGVWLGEPLVYWDHLALTGVTGFASWHGNFLVVASDQQSTGLAVYDVSGFKEGRVPRLLGLYNDQRTEPSGNQIGVGGYWVEPYGTTKMAFSARERSEPNRDHPAFYIIDFEDPTNPYLSCELYFDQDANDPSDGDNSSDPMYVGFQDNYAYADHFQIDIEACEAAFEDDSISDEEFSNIVFKFEDVANQCDSSQYFRPIGQVGIFGGYDWWVNNDEGINEQGMCFFVTSDEADTRAPYISGHRPLANQEGVPIDTLIHIHIPETLRTESVENSVMVTHVGSGSAVEFRYQLSHTGTLGVWPDEYLEANSTYRVDISGIQDFMGNTMSPYSYSFSTNDGDLLEGDTPQNPTQPPDGGGAEAAPTYSGPTYFPNKSNQLACLPEDEASDIWVVNPNNDSVAIIQKSYDPDTFETSHSLAREIDLGYEAPTSISHMGDSYAVSYRDDDKVVFFSEEGYPLFSIDTGHGTQPINSVSDGTYLYVALYASGELLKIDIAGRSISARIDLGPKPKAMALAGERLLITRFISAQDHGEVYDVNTADSMSLSRIIVVNQVTVPDDIDHGSGVPNYLAGIVIDQNAQWAYVTAKKDNVDRGLRPGDDHNAQALDDDNTVRPMMIAIDLLNNRDANIDPATREGSLDLDDAADPSGVSYLPNPNIRINAFQGNNIVTLNNSEANTSASFSTGSAPQEICSTRRTAYVKNFADRSVSAIDISGYLHDGRLSPEIQTISTVSSDILSEEELRGLQLFYSASIPEMGPEGYMSCASCHFGAGGDGRVWDLTNMGEGLRNTLSLNGASGTRFGNLHWSGNFDEVQDFEIQMEQLNAGEGLVRGPATFNGVGPLDLVTTGLSADLDALAAYINGLGKDTVKRSPYKSYTGELTEAALRGEIIFNEDNCASCHTGEAYRDGLMHDVGTIIESSGQRLNASLEAIRTPSLIELWDSAPYLHDGRALELEDVFSFGDHQRDYSEEQLSDLLTYLLSIDRELYIDDE